MMFLPPYLFIQYFNIIEMEIFYIGEYMAAINNINIKAKNLSIK